MKILCIIDSLGSGGAQRQLVNLAISFKKSGHTVSFLLYHEFNFFKGLLDENDIPVNIIKQSNYITRLIKMRSFIRKGNFDSVLSFLEGSNFIAEVSGLPYRRWNLVVGERSANPQILKSTKLKIYRYFHCLADHIVANSNENMSMVRKVNPFLQEDKCHVIYNMVRITDTPMVVNRAAKFKIVVAAGHSYNKNLRNLIKAVSLLSDEKRKVLLIDWYGDKRTDGSLNEGMKLIETLGLKPNFNFYPATSQIIQIKLQADAVGLFSFHEGLPNTLCEAMAIGKVVVSSRVSDIPKFIQNENLLCDANAPTSIKKALEYLLDLGEEDLSKIGENNHAVAIENFNEAAVVDSYLKLLTKRN